MSEKRSPKHEEARNTLPDDLKPVFDEFVADYKYAASMGHGAPYVSCIVLADMVQAGWRCTVYRRTTKRICQMRSQMKYDVFVLVNNSNEMLTGALN